MRVDRVWIVSLATTLSAAMGLVQAKEKLAARKADMNQATLTEGISPDQFERLHKMIGPQPGELAWRNLPWLIDLPEARQKATQEGKPIFLMVGSGALPVGCA